MILAENGKLLPEVTTAGTKSAISRPFLFATRSHRPRAFSHNGPQPAYGGPVDVDREIAFLQTQLAVLLESRPPHQSSRRVQALARIRARLAELERQREGPRTFRVIRGGKED